MSRVFACMCSATEAGLCCRTHVFLWNSATGTSVLHRLMQDFVGKLQVSFAEYRLFYRAHLQKRPIILSILLAEATLDLCQTSLALGKQNSVALSLASFERWGAGVEYHFQEFNEPYAPS